MLQFWWSYSLTYILWDPLAGKGWHYTWGRFRVVSKRPGIGRIGRIAAWETMNWLPRNSMLAHVASKDGDLSRQKVVCLLEETLISTSNKRNTINIKLKYRIDLHKTDSFPANCEVPMEKDMTKVLQKKRIESATGLVNLGSKKHKQKCEYWSLSGKYMRI